MLQEQDAGDVMELDYKKPVKNLKLWIVWTYLLYLLTQHN